MCSSDFYEWLDQFGNIGIGSTSPSTELAIHKTGTSTIYNFTSTSGKGSAIQMNTPNGSVFCLYLANDTGALTSVAGSCK